MQDISLHILDIAQNSIEAKSSLIEINIVEDWQLAHLTVTIKDNGSGMDAESVEQVVNPFYTTRTTRKVGLGIPLFKQAAESCGGSFAVESYPNCGSIVKADFDTSNIDCPPLGNIEETIVALILCNPSVNFIYSHKTSQGTFCLDTRAVRNKIGGSPSQFPEVMQWIYSYIKEGLHEICGGV